MKVDTSKRDELVLGYMPKVSSIARGLKRRRLHSADVEELTAAGYLALVRRAGMYRGRNGCSFDTYAFQAIAGAMITAHARPEGRKGYHRMEWLPLEYARSLGEPSSIAEAFEMKEMRSRLLSAVRRLGPAQRRVVSLYLFEDLSFDEIAHRLEFRYHRVYKLYRLAVGNLKRLLNKGGCGGGNLHGEREEKRGGV